MYEIRFSRGSMNEMEAATRAGIRFAVIVALTLTASGQAQQKRCMHFTNFCDSITLQASGDIAYGGWNWQCYGDWTSVNIIGSIEKSHELATRPLDDEYPSPYTMQFSFKAGKLFDLYESYGIGRDILTYRSNEPYTITDGACTLSDIESSKPRLMSNTNTEAVRLQSKAATRCMHFKNFCDTIVFSLSGGLAYGDWDWECLGDWTTSYIMGNATAGQELATRPKVSGYPYLSFYSMQFSFKSGQLFDLYQTAGVDQGVSKTRSDEPFTITSGACLKGDVDTTKPRLVNP